MGKRTRAPRTPQKKVIAAGAGAGIAVQLGIIFVYLIEEFLHDMPTEVEGAVVAVMVVLCSVVSGYLTPESPRERKERNGEDR